MADSGTVKPDPAWRRRLRGRWPGDAGHLLDIAVHRLRHAAGADTDEEAA